MKPETGNLKPETILGRLPACNAERSAAGRMLGVGRWAFSLFVFLQVSGLILHPSCATAQVFSDADFRGDVSTSSWSCVSNVTIGTTTGGYYTSGTLTNYYRLSGTNQAGRIPLATNVYIVFTGNTNGTTNAVFLTWTRKPGIAQHIIEKSFDQGGSWSNWLAVSATSTNWTDTGSNTWTQTIFTNAYSAIPAQTLPWTSSERIHFTAGFFDVVDTTQLVFVSGSVTNVIDPDITSP
jgi:hypothetical protein